MGRVFSELRGVQLLCAEQDRDNLSKERRSSIVLLLLPTCRKGAEACAHVAWVYVSYACCVLGCLFAAGKWKDGLLYCHDIKTPYMAMQIEYDDGGFFHCWGVHFFSFPTLVSPLTVSSPIETKRNGLAPTGLSHRPTDERKTVAGDLS